MIGAHYPERSFKIFILNAPWWFNVVWKVRTEACLRVVGVDRVERSGVCVLGVLSIIWHETAAPSGSGVCGQQPGPG